MSKARAKRGCGPARFSPFGIACCCHCTETHGFYYTTEEACEKDSPMHNKERDWWIRTHGQHFDEEKIQKDEEKTQKDEEKIQKAVSKQIQQDLQNAGEKGQLQALESVQSSPKHASKVTGIFYGLAWMIQIPASETFKALGRPLWNGAN